MTVYKCSIVIPSIAARLVDLLLFKNNNDLVSVIEQWTQSLNVYLNLKVIMTFYRLWFPYHSRIDDVLYIIKGSNL